MLPESWDSAVDAEHRCFAFLARALNPLESDQRAIDALREEIGRVAWESVVELASRHLVTPTLYRGLADKGLLADLPADVRDYLGAIHALNDQRNRRLLHQTVEIAAALNGVGIEPVALKGMADLCAGLYPDPGARVIGDIDLLVASNQLAAAVAALAAIGYRASGPADFAYGSHHHDRPLARPDDAAWVELHTEPVAPAFASLLPGDRMLCAARRVAVGGQALGLPSPREQVVHNIVHTQLADRHYWLARVPLRPLADLARLRLQNDDRIDWREILAAFDRAGHGSACRAWLITAERLFGQDLPDGVTPDLGARLACWRIRLQERHPWLMAAGDWYGYHQAMLAELGAGPAPRRRVLARLLHPKGYRRYSRALRTHMSRAL